MNIESRDPAWEAGIQNRDAINDKIRRGVEQLDRGEESQGPTGRVPG